MRIPRWLAGALCALLGACAHVHETTLDNGLKVVVKPDRRSPVVVSQLWYKVGSSDEPAGLTGISHVLEHMMFKGSERLAPGEFSRIIAEHGGRENAFTSKDYTAYYQQLEKSRLPVSFELEAERMRKLRLPDEEFQKEVKVVMEERRLRTDDRPEGLLYEQFMATAYQVHPYRNPIIGWMDDLKTLRVEELKDWYRRWYAPNNATLVVVGDVEPRAVFALANKYFGAIPRAAVAPTPAPVEPPQQAMRRTRVAAPAEVPSMLLGFHVPQFRTGREWEPYALEVLAGVLDGGSSARFARELVRERQIANSADADYGSVARHPSMFLVSATPARGRGVEELERALLAQIERLRTEPVSDAELARVKAQVVAGNVFNLDSLYYQAMQIGMLETSGVGWRLLDEYVEGIRKVSARQVQEVAQRYLVETNLTVAVLDPQPMSRRAPRSAPGANSHAH
ncbi:MAG: insulinase family protein [Gammaproteobacteria bacterium]|nr:insulinase family protein [Gammaproteobacteria bacterium]